MQQMGRSRDTVDLWRGLESRSRDLLDLTELAIEEGDDSLEEQLESDFAALSRALDREEVKLTLSGHYDERSAIISIHSGAGGTDSHDWAQMLLQMYSGWAEGGKRPLEVLDLSYGDEAGLRSGILEVGGDHAFGYLSDRTGGASAGQVVAPTTPTTCATPPLPMSKYFRQWKASPMSISVPRTSGWTLSGQAVPAARMCRKWPLRSG